MLQISIGDDHHSPYVSLRELICRIPTLDKSQSPSKERDPYHQRTVYSLDI